MPTHDRAVQNEQSEQLGQWSQITKRTFDLLRELGDINASLVSGFARQQLQLVGASTEVGTRQLQLFLQPRQYYRDLLDRESSLLIDYNTRIVEIARKGTNIVSEATERLADWVQKGAATVEENAQTAARDIERVAERAEEGVERAARSVEKAVARGAATLNVAEAATGNGGEPTLSVLPREDGWAVQVVGASRATSVHATKEEAVERARALAADRAPSRLVVYKKDGTVQDEVSYPA
ncbi:MAG: DUF2188 domain-containing protein [Chloroflexota bacterium]|nr:DUF2188 domain-containing protein [Chloroflexota bacterium]